MIIMKGLFGILLSVMILALAGCGSTKVGSNTESGTKEVTETAEQSEEVKKESEQVVEITTENVKETAPASDKDKAGADLNDSGKEKPSEQTSKENRTEAVSTKNESANDKTSREEAAPTPTPKPVEKKPEQSTQTREEPVTEAKAISYSPDTVVALAIAKCQAGGMITTQDNLANALAEGRITQEEYNEYYPYDGLEDSYYSVFVETDLNKASSMSGQALGSEDAIAGYIADMLLLENSPVFNIVYAGTYTQNGTTFYEFRCLR